MVTSNQEQLYKEIIEYYQYADNLIKVVENSKSKYVGEQFKIVEDLVKTLENCTEQLANQYIDFIKNGSSQKNATLIRNALNLIVAKIEETRNKMYMLYDINLTDV